MGLEHLSRLTMLNRTTTKQIALYTVEVMTIFLSTGHFFLPIPLPYQCPQCPCRFYPTIFSHFPPVSGLSGWTHVVLIQGHSCIRQLTSSLNARDEVQTPSLSLKVLVWVLFLYRTILSIKFAETACFGVLLTLPSSRFTWVKTFDRPCDHTQHCS